VTVCLGSPAVQLPDLVVEAPATARLVFGTDTTEPNAGMVLHRRPLAASLVALAEIVVEVRGELYMGPPKTRAGRRIVTLPRSVVEELAEHLRPVGGADAWVFTADKGGVLRPCNFRATVWLPDELRIRLDAM
jgi:hypothetical protein